MRKAIVGLAMCLSAMGLSASRVQAQDNSDVFLAPLSVRNGVVVVGAPTNITNRTGYDNQPSFTPDGKHVLFTSRREDAQADIYSYSLESHRITQVTKTPESEYSATVMPSGDRFSVIRVEPDSTQRLWSFRLDGSDPRLVVERLKPVGYHAWIDDHRLATFVLGVARSPNALVLVDLKAGTFDTVTRNIGRSLTPLPRGRGYSYAQRTADSGWALMRVDGPRSPTDKGREVARLPKGADYVAWVTAALPVTGAGSKLMQWDAVARLWRDVADFGQGPIRLNRISRLAVSPDGKWLAIVAEP